MKTPDFESGRINRIARTRFKFLARRSNWNGPILATHLRAARLDYTPEEWISLSIFYGFIFGIVTFVVSFLFLFLSQNPLIWIIIGISPTLGGVVYTMSINSPGRLAKKRGLQIDQQLYFVVNYMATMAASGMTPLQAMKNVASKEIYGEASKEFAQVVRDTDLMGMDIYSALRNMGETTPSFRLKEFIEGFISTSNSSGNVSTYLLNLLENYQQEAKIINKKKVEMVGLLSEIFVIVGLLFPLLFCLFIVIIAIATGGSTGNFLTAQIFFIAFVIMPAIFVAFIWLFKTNRIGVD